MNSFRGIILSMLFLPALSGCGASQSPEGVANDFWDAMMKGDKAAAQKYATKESGAAIAVQGKQEGEERKVILGEPQKNEDHVSIPTTLVTITGGNEQKIPTNTILVKEDGAWKVDWNRTAAAMLGGAMGEMMKGMQDAMKEMGKAFEEAAKPPQGQ